MQESFLALWTRQRVLVLFDAARWHDCKTRSAYPEDKCGQQHEKTGNRKGDLWPVAFKQKRRKERGKKRTKIDGEIKYTEHLFDEVLILFGELIAHIRAHYRLDPAGTDRDEREPHHHARRIAHQRQYKTANGINNGQPHDGFVLAPKHVGDNRTNEWRKVGGGTKQVIPTFGGGFVDMSQLTVHAKQILGHVHDQNGAHAIVTETFRGLVADDERDPLGHLGGG